MNIDTIINYVTSYLNVRNTMDNLRIYLRALEPDDFLISYKWRNDHELIKGYSSIPRFVSSETERKWVLKSIEEHEVGKKIQLAVCTISEEELIGYVSLTQIDRQNRDCVVGLMIGDRNYLKKGLAAEARFLLFKYAFMELDMNRVSSRIHSYNVAAIKSAETFGYQKEGILRKAIYRNGRFHDVYLYSMLKEEFIKLYLD